MQGRTMPTRAAHAALYVGYPMLVGVTAPNMNQTKFQITMNSNSYVGQVRQQVASKPEFNIQPECLRMFLGGMCNLRALAQNWEIHMRRRMRVGLVPCLHVIQFHHIKKLRPVTSCVYASTVLANLLVCIALMQLSILVTPWSPTALIQQACNLYTSAHLVHLLLMVW